LPDDLPAQTLVHDSLMDFANHLVAAA
jgi:hypothetical protein